jgi:hypothetical protein
MFIPFSLDACRFTLSRTPLLPLLSAVYAFNESAGAWTHEAIVHFFAALFGRKDFRRLQRRKMLRYRREIELRKLCKLMYAVFAVQKLLGDPKTDRMP